LFVVGLLVCTQAATARAQTSVYVSGAVFADLRRGSGQTSPDSTALDATTAGGGVRVGGFLAARWSLELGVDAGGTTDVTASLSPTSPASLPPATTLALSVDDVFGTGTSIVAVTLDRRVQTRVTATSVLLGYHPPARGRLRAGFKGGISFVRSGSTVTSTFGFRITDPRLAPFLLLPAPTSTTSTSVHLDMAPAVAAELAIALSAHAAIIPEMRALGFGDQIILRPGAAVRWTF
jgi:hypothetical protein